MGIQIEMGQTTFQDPKGGARRIIYWDPTTAISGHAILVGSSGVGKTYRLRYLIKHLIERTRNVNIHILDVHGDIAPIARNRIVFSEASPYGLNPLEIETDPEFGGVRRRINAFISMINRTTHKLGSRQEAVLRNMLYELYTLNGYDPKNSRTWNPATNPRVSGTSALTGKHPGIPELLNLIDWRTKDRVIGGGSPAIKSIAEVTKLTKKVISTVQKDEDANLPALVLARQRAIENFSAFINNVKNGDELDNYMKYDSVDVMMRVLERIQALDEAGIFRDKPPHFSNADPLRVYDIKALHEDEQSMFVEVLLERLFIEAKARGPRPAPDTFIIIDEAHKFMTDDNEHIINRMAREVRKFGVGLILVSQSFDHFPEDIIANSAMTMILGLHDMHHERAARMLGLDRKRFKFIKPQQTALVQVRTGGAQHGLTNAFTDIQLAS